MAVGGKFFQSFIGTYVFQRDLCHAATRLDHQASEKEGRKREMGGERHTGVYRKIKDPREQNVR